jgi:hypothetical protein
MKQILTFILSTLTLCATAQCEGARPGYAYWGFPSFNSLYVGNKCISQNITGDTTICVKYDQILASQQAYFSYSSPAGFPAFITQIRQYNAQCVFIGYGSLIAPGIDSLTICYDIQTQLIDNFCPYALITSPLAVEWCGTSCRVYDGFLQVGWKTCTNINTHKFVVCVSQDAVTWAEAISVPPHSVNNSNESEYSVTLPYDYDGMSYVMVREYDLNGDISNSEIRTFVCQSSKGNSGGSNSYDLLGRVGSSSNYQWYIKK